MDPVVARKTWRTLEPIHLMTYWAREPVEECLAIGMRDEKMAYFAYRAGPMGAVSAEVVMATFFNFNPEVVRSAIPEAWSIAPPHRIHAARLAGVERFLRRAVADVDTGTLQEAAELARSAALAAYDHLEGRPLFAGHASVDWPDPSDSLLTLFWAQTLLREFRGDGHIATLVAEGVSGIEALVIHAATGEIPVSFQLSAKEWSEDDWSAAVERLRARGLVEATGDLALTDTGRVHRQRVEDRTDELARPAYEPLGEAGCKRLRELARPLSRALMGAVDLSNLAGT